VATLAEVETASNEKQTYSQYVTNIYLCIT